nr:hypothetical protein [Tanacetum cinerariifolium]
MHENARTRKRETRYNVSHRRVAFSETIWAGDNSSVYETISHGAARVFESERKWGWEVVKEKQVSIRVKLFDRKKMNTDASTSLFTKSDRTLNDANPLKEVVSPSVIDEHVAMEVQSPLVAQTYSVKSHVVEETVTMECLVVNTPDVGLNPPLPMQEANSAGNVPGKPSYATATGKPNGKKGISSYARVMIKLRADVELKDNTVIAMPKITRDGYYTCNVHVKYKWKPPRCSSCKVLNIFMRNFRRIQVLVRRRL